MKIRNQVEFKVWGRYALFSDPITRLGGEKFTYQVPTYQALKGIAESIYWKPTFIWVIDEVRVMRPIRTESKNIRPINYTDSGNTLSVYTYLADVCYHVRAHFIWNEHRPELASDRNEHKHHNIARRMIERGGRRDIFLGARECQGYVEPCGFDEGKGFYDGEDCGTTSFGLMVHGFDYPDETGRNMLAVRLWRAHMEKGVIRFPKPEDCLPELRRDIRPMRKKEFGEEKFSGLAEEGLDELAKEEDWHGLDAAAGGDI